MKERLRTLNLSVTLSDPRVELVIASTSCKSGRKRAPGGLVLAQIEKGDSEKKKKEKKLLGS